MNLNIVSTNQFDKDFKSMFKRGKKRENLDKVISLLLVYLLLISLYKNNLSVLINENHISVRIFKVDMFGT